MSEPVLVTVAITDDADGEEFAWRALRNAVIVPDPSCPTRVKLVVTGSEAKRLTHELVELVYGGGT